MKMKRADIIIKSELLIKPLNKDDVIRYREDYNSLPPITVNKNSVLIDGRNRLGAAKELEKKEIEVNVMDIPEEEIPASSYSLNSKHGKACSFAQRDKIIWSYSKENPESEYKWTQQTIANKMEITKQRVGQIIKSKIALQINNSPEKSSKNSKMKKTKAEVTEDKIKLSEEELKQEKGKEPTQQEIADHAEVTKGRVSQAKKKRKKEQDHKEKLKTSEEVIPYHWQKDRFSNFKIELVNPFTLTGYPFDPEDAVCPHFLELKWAWGCPYQCAWCYLQGAFKGNMKGRVREGLKVVKDICEFFDQKKTKAEILNTGELSDSIAIGGKNLQVLMLSLFAEQEKHKILFLTKSDQVDHLINLPNKTKRQAIISFSLNASKVAEQWEKKAPSIKQRLDAAKKLSEAGYDIRLRIDPIVPIKDWQSEYIDLLDDINFKFERITLGTLRVVNEKTIEIAEDKSWAEYLERKVKTGWGLKMKHNVRLEVNSFMIEEIKNRWEKVEIGFCKETRNVWEKLELDWRNIKCNCVI